MADQAAEQVRKPRADAVRNRERVLAAAKSVFSAGGADASLEAVARRAGVGIGTLYRHFPTREALFEAVYRREVEQLSELAEQLKNDADPVEAVRIWLRSNVEFVATKKGMMAALALAAYGSSELFTFSFDRLTKAVGALLQRAVAAGKIRADIGPEDVLHIAVWKESDLTATLPVRPDGKISLPLLDDVQASGLTPKQLAVSVTEKLKKYIADPRVTVVVTAINSKRVYLTGEVLHSGAMTMLPNMTVLQALSSAGISQFANTKRIYVLRTQNGKQEKLPVNYRKLVKGELIDENYLLQPGDTIVVP